MLGILYLFIFHGERGNIMNIEHILKMNELEDEAINDNEHNFNCIIVVKEGERENIYCFDDYRVARSISNLLDNVKFVSKMGSREITGSSNNEV